MTVGVCPELFGDAQLRMRISHVMQRSKHLRLILGRVVWRSLHVTMDLDIFSLIGPKISQCIEPQRKCMEIPFDQNIGFTCSTDSRYYMANTR